MICFKTKTGYQVVLPGCYLEFKDEALERELPEFPFDMKGKTPASTLLRWSNQQLTKGSTKIDVFLLPQAVREVVTERVIDPVLKSFLTRPVLVTYPNIPITYASRYEVNKALNDFQEGMRKTQRYLTYDFMHNVSLLLNDRIVQWRMHLYDIDGMVVTSRLAKASKENPPFAEFQVTYYAGIKAWVLSRVMIRSVEHNPYSYGLFLDAEIPRGCPRYSYLVDKFKFGIKI